MFRKLKVLKEEGGRRGMRLLRPIMEMVLLTQGVKASGAEFRDFECGFGGGRDDRGYGAHVSLDDSIFYGDVCRDRRECEVAERYAPIQQEIFAAPSYDEYAAPNYDDYTTPNYGEYTTPNYGEYTTPNYSESAQYNASSSYEAPFPLPYQAPCPPQYQAPCPPEYQAPCPPSYQAPIYQTPTYGQTQYYPETYTEATQQQAASSGVSTLYPGGAQGGSQPGYVAPCPPLAQAAASQYIPGTQASCYIYPAASGQAGQAGQTGQTASSGQVSVLMNGEIPVGLTPQSLTVGNVTYPLPQANPMGTAAGVQNMSISPLHTPEEIAAGLAGSGLSAEQIAAMEKVAGGATNATGNTTNATKKGSKKKGKKGKKGGAKKGAAKKKNGAAGIPLLITFVVIPLALLLM
jgi:hypothetical protein